MLQYYTSKKRLLSLLVAAIFLFSVIFLRLAYIQVVWGSALKSRAAEQWQRDLPIKAYRGDIVDREGRTIATTHTGYSLYARPQSVSDADGVSKTLSQILDKDSGVLYSKLTAKGISEVTLARMLSDKQVEAVRNADLRGVYLAANGVRDYVYGEFLSQVLGFVSSDGSGQTGLEAYYNKYLAGIDGELLTDTDLVGKELESGTMSYVAAIDGLTLTLTIDATIQLAVENVLELALHNNGPVSARAVVMDVNTGEVLAMAAKPSVDLNNLPRDNVELLMQRSKNTLLTDVYEPGSTFKVITAAACLEEYKNGNPRAFSEMHVFNSSGVRIINGSKISCWTKHANGKHSNQNLSDALNNSCNPIFTDIALSLGKDIMYKYLGNFGFGKTTDIDFAGEQSGILVSQNAVTDGDLARIGFGHTIAVTPIQLCAAISAAVNGGYLMRPYLVKEISDPTTGQTVRKTTPTVVSRPISETTSQKIAGYLRRVVDEGGGKNAKIDGYQVGGKTGTAQKFEGGKLAVGKYESSFIGFFPASSPKYLALVIIDEPQGQSYGSIVAAPYARMIFEQIIAYKEIASID